MKKVIGHRLNAEQLKRASEICMGIGHIAFASVVLPALFDKFNMFLIILGLVAASGSWLISILILRRKNEYR